MVHTNLILLASLVGVARGAVLPRDDTPDLPKVASFSASGNGCPQDTSTYLGAHGDILSFAFPSFNVEDISPSEKNKNCQMHLSFKGDVSGWQFAIQTIRIRGHATLSPNSTLTTYLTTYYSQDASNTVREIHEVFF
jgi:hypothetical protein